MKGPSSSRRRFKTFGPPVVVLAMVVLWPTGFARQFENVTLDWRFRFREAWDPPAVPDLLVVGIDEYSLERFGRWPWPRGLHGEFLADFLTLRPPKVVAFDLLFTEPSEDPAEDEAFGEGLSFHPGAITAAFAAEGALRVSKPPYLGKTEPLVVEGDIDSLIGGDRGPLPVPVLAESGWTGFANVPPSPIDGVRRKLPLVVRYGDRVYPGLVLQCLMQFMELGPEDVDIRLGDALEFSDGDGRVMRVPLDERGRVNINYRNGDRLNAADYAALAGRLAAHGGGDDWPEAATDPRGRILMIGQTAEGLTDFGPTPFRPEAPLVMVHANALDMILRGDYLAIAPAAPVWAGWLLVAWLSLWWMGRLRAVWAVAVPLGAVMAYVGGAVFLFIAGSIQLPLFLPVTGFVLLQGGVLVDRLVAEMRAKGRIKALFGTYVSPELVEIMVDSGEPPRLGGTTEEVTAFFSDVEGFSSFSELLPAEQLVSLMNEYLTEMTGILQGRGGTLDKYIGDAMVGMFGAPVALPDHAYRACAAAAEIQLRQLELRERWAGRGEWPEEVCAMRTRIGLHTGEAVIGNMGSASRFNYTMMGDNVNLAARCESGAKFYGVLTMVTGETRRAAEGAGDQLVFRLLDRVVVKGRSQPVEVHELLGWRGGLGQGVLDLIARYERALDRYFARHWDEAGVGFASSAALEGEREGAGSGPSEMMRLRCQQLGEDPPGPDWDGVFRMSAK